MNTREREVLQINSIPEDWILDAFLLEQKYDKHAYYY